MASIIDETYFDGRLYIDTSNLATSELLMKYVDQITDEIFMELFNTKSPSFDEEPLKSIDYKSMIAAFSYFHFVSEYAITPTSTGEHAKNTTGGVNAIGKVKLINAYNTGVDIFNSIVDYIDNNEDSFSFFPCKRNYINRFGI